MAMTYGPKRLTVGAHYGWRDFLVQRMSGVYLGLYTVVLALAIVFTSGPMDHAKWVGIFTPQWMKFLTFVAILAVIWHAWVGMVSIWYDYAKPTGLRLIIHSLTAVWLLGCAGWAVQVLWQL